MIRGWGAGNRRTPLRVIEHATDFHSAEPLSPGVFGCDAEKTYTSEGVSGDLSSRQNKAWNAESRSYTRAVWEQ